MRAAASSGVLGSSGSAALGSETKQPRFLELLKDLSCGPWQQLRTGPGKARA